MTPEEKAERYDEALRRARKLKEDPTSVFYEYSPSDGDTIADYIFPELKESEDEKIRKAIISGMTAIKNNQKKKTFADIPIDDCIAWLEKQSEQKNKINSYNITFEDVLVLECCMKTIKITEGGDELYEMLVPLYDKIHNAYLAEKQGEQKPSEEYNITGIGSKHAQGKLGEMIKNLKPVDNSNRVEPKDYNSIDPHFMKPVDKVEPKFHEGEWIVWQDKCYKVNYNGCGYELVDQNGLSTSLEYGIIDENAHLFNIQDAKAGDVIYSKHNTEDFEWIGIFKSLDEGVHFYGFWNNVTKTFKVCNNEIFVLYDDFSLATKEQRNMLMEAITEAGYEWDANELEAKKIENVQELAEKNLAWNENDDIMLHDIIDYFENRTLTLPYDVFLYIPWLKSLRNRINCKADKS